MSPKSSMIIVDNLLTCQMSSAFMYNGGIGWTPTNYRMGQATTVRNRELAVQSIINVSNYEHIFALQFHQAGEVMVKVRATGIVSTQPTDEGISVLFCTLVHPGVLNSNHQHIFSLRLVPMLSGPFNRLLYDEAHPMPRSELNPFGIGNIVTETPITTSGVYDQDIDTNRIFKIQNPAFKNPVNGQPVLYKIQAPPFQKMPADKESFNHAQEPQNAVHRKGGRQ